MNPTSRWSSDWTWWFYIGRFFHLNRAMQRSIRRWRRKRRTPRTKIWRMTAQTCLGLFTASLVGIWGAEEWKNWHGSCQKTHNSRIVLLECLIFVTFDVHSFVVMVFSFTLLLNQERGALLRCYSLTLEIHRFFAKYVLIYILYTCMYIYNIYYISKDSGTCNTNSRQHQPDNQIKLSATPATPIDSALCHASCQMGSNDGDDEARACAGRNGRAGHAYHALCSVQQGLHHPPCCQERPIYNPLNLPLGGVFHPIFLESGAQRFLGPTEGWIWPT